MYRLPATKAQPRERGEPGEKRRETRVRFTEYNNQRFRESQMAENR